MPDPKALESFLRMDKFPLRVTHHRCEPLHALFARTVERNIRGEVTPYAAALGIPAANRVANLPVAEVARLCGTDPSGLAHASPSFDGNHTWLMGQRLRRGDMAFDRRRWCPDCLRETGVHHAWWDIVAVTTCPKHSCALVESCICGLSVTWRNAGFYNCACGRLLARVPAGRLAVYHRATSKRTSVSSLHVGPPAAG